MAKADTEKEAHLNGDEPSPAAPESSGDTASIPSTSSEIQQPLLLGNDLIF